MKFLNKKGESALDSFKPIIITFVVAAVVIAIGGAIVSSLQTTAGANNGSAAGGNAVWNITGQGGAGMTQLSSYLPILGLVVIAALVISFLVMAMRGSA